MILRVKCVIFLASLGIMLNNVKLCEGNVNEDDDTDEDKALKDALLLIRLIKTGIPPNMPEEVAELFSTYTSIIPVPTPAAPSPPINVDTVTNTFQPIDKVQRRKMLKGPYRRKINNEIVNGVISTDVKQRPALYRRNNYDNPFKAQPYDPTDTDDNFTTTVGPTTTMPSASKAPTAASKKETTEATVSSTSAKLLRSQQLKKKIYSVKTTASGISSTRSSKVQHRNTRKRLPLGHGRRRRRKQQTQQKQQQNHRLLKGHKQKTQRSGTSREYQDSHARNPVLEQVQNELENEMKGVKMSDSGKNDRDEDFDFIEFRRAVTAGTTIPTTLRIHLEQSTRYPVPYPENHAFCFFHPENGLCRTMIG